MLTSRAICACSIDGGGEPGIRTTSAMHACADIDVIFNGVMRSSNPPHCVGHAYRVTPSIGSIPFRPLQGCARESCAYASPVFFLNNILRKNSNRSHVRNRHSSVAVSATEQAVSPPTRHATSIPFGDRQVFSSFFQSWRFIYKREFVNQFSN